MAILNFQKPDKVIMIDSSDFEGKFEFRPLEPGYGLTVGNALRSSAKSAEKLIDDAREAEKKLTTELNEMRKKIT